MTDLLTTSLKEITINDEQLRRENDALKTDIIHLKARQKDEITQLQAGHKDEIEQLTIQLDSQDSEIAQLKTENLQLKVS